MQSFSLSFSLLSILTVALTAVLGQDEHEYVGYLMTTFIDPVPQIHWHLSDGDSPRSFRPLNNGEPVLETTVGTGGVRDPFLVTNSERSEYYLLATDLDINIANFTWDTATRQGSRSLVIWSSPNLLDWSAPSLVTVEDDTAGMAWAPSAVYDAATAQYHVFWAARHFDPSDAEHTGSPTTLNRIRYASTRDFTSFSAPADYLADDNVAVIDQEFQALDAPGAYVRFIKDESAMRVYQETTTEGIFGTWNRTTPGEYVDGGSGAFEGAASFADIRMPGVYHLLLDDYTEYVPFSTGEILGGVWERSEGAEGFPRGVKHGCVSRLTREEYDDVSERFL